MPAGAKCPSWYQVKVESLLMPLEAALAPLLPGSDPVAQKRARAHAMGERARHDLAIDGGQALARYRRMPDGSLVDDLVSTYLAGLQQRARRPATR